MGFPNLPNISPEISLTTEQTIDLLLASIAMEELALAHVMNAEAEKVQYVLGTLYSTGTIPPPTVENLHEVNRSLQNTLNGILQKEILLDLKFKSIL